MRRALCERFGIGALKGDEDVDFCQIKVFSRVNPEKGMPHIYLSHPPAEDIRPCQPVRFRGCFQGKGDGSIKLDFDDVTVSPTTRPEPPISLPTTPFRNGGGRGLAGHTPEQGPRI
jgi:hypothetical protein